MEQSTQKIRIITHNGSFHADELLAIATLDLFLGGMRDLKTKIFAFGKLENLA